MTTKRDKKKDEPKADERPKLQKEKLRDLDAKHQAESVKGGIPKSRTDCVGG